MSVEIHVYEWKDIDWVDVGSFTVSADDVRISDAYGDSRLTNGGYIRVAIPDGTYGDGSRMSQHIVLEAVHISHIWGFSSPEFEGFASVEVYDDSQVPLWRGYRKMRWRVKET